MLFKEAYLKMLEGCKIKRPCFEGYWYIDGVTGNVVIHLASGEEITEGKLTLTIQNTLANDWCLYVESDSIEPKKWCPPSDNKKYLKG